MASKDIIAFFLFVICVASSFSSLVSPQPLTQSYSQSYSQPYSLSENTKNKQKQEKTKPNKHSKNKTKTKTKQKNLDDLRDVKEDKEDSIDFKTRDDTKTDSMDFKTRIKRDTGTKRSLEGRIRTTVEKMFNMPFPKTKPPWLINPETGRRLELDCYCEKLNIAIEYQGEGHFIYMPTRYHRKGIQEFEDQKFRDGIKKRICIENGVKLICVPYWINEDEVESFIKKNLY
jgi:hypothetical protein